MGCSGIVANDGMIRKIVAWSMMSKPYTKTPEEENAPKPPSMRPDTTDLRIWATHERSAEIMKAHGYYPTTDFCKSPKNTTRFAMLVGHADGWAARSGLLVDPSYQKLGLGTRLAVFDNEIADEAGARIWVIASSNSKKLFLSLGFVVLETESVVLEESEDGGKKVGTLSITMREPKGREAE
jgi:GNAT superfamily N-acetyltransferase